jgi:hypothetical protein
MEKYVANMHLPSRTRAVAMAERLQYVERLLGRSLLPVKSSCARSMDGRGSQQDLVISLTSVPDHIA